jgi:hypothetical protein
MNKSAQAESSTFQPVVKKASQASATVSRTSRDKVVVHIPDQSIFLTKAATSY